MILASGSTAAVVGGPAWLALLAVVCYVLAALPIPALERSRAAAALFVAAWMLHFVALVFDIGGIGLPAPATRLGFAPVLSATLWLVIAVYAVESRFLPLPAVRRWLAPIGALVVVLALAFPGEPRHFGSVLAPLHFMLGVASHGLFGAAVLHGAMLDAAERRLRSRGAASGGAFGMPLLQLERLTFRFVEFGFIVLSAALLLGVVSTEHWHWGHKQLLSLLSWGVFAALLVGRHLRGWRGRRATRWLYVGAVLLLLAYVGWRFVLQVILHRGAS